MPWDLLADYYERLAQNLGTPWPVEWSELHGAVLRDQILREELRLRPKIDALVQTVLATEHPELIDTLNANAKFFLRHRAQSAAQFRRIAMERKFEYPVQRPPVDVVAEILIDLWADDFAPIVRAQWEKGLPLDGPATPGASADT